jgi:hypothetical protein
MKEPKKFDAWYTSVWVWIWISMVPLGIILGILGNRK